MDARFLGQQLRLFQSSGKLIPVEQQAILCNSLTLAKHKNRFNKILFWGCIQGVKDDYLIAQGITGTDELCDRVTLYSINSIDWQLLSVPDEKMQEDAMQIRDRFTGDPQFEYEQHEVRRYGAGANAQDDEMTIHVKEEDRLATVVLKIDQEAMLVPRGAYMRSPAGIVTPNAGFAGLSLEKSRNLENWLHFSAPVRLPKKSLLEQADATAPIDFLEQASADVPTTGSWSVQTERGDGVDAPLIKLRSLHWLGAECCHIPGTKEFSRTYCGQGFKNINLPFMLPTKQA